MLEVHHISKSYGGKPILNDISFRVDTGETVCLLGASGSGKSTLLRIIAGLEHPDSGSVSFNGQDLTSTPAHLRDFGLVFQDYALFPHLNVRDNVAFGLRMRRLPEDELAERVAHSLELVNLGGFGERQVIDLSGGEQQRVALARALAIRPRLLMFDEPLGALDRTLREDLLDELRSILHHTSVPAIYVTHDQEEASVIADRLMLLHNGTIVREGTPAEVWENPASAFVAEFLGVGNVIDGMIGSEKIDDQWKVESVVGEFSVGCEHHHQKGDRVHLLVRPVPVDAGANIVRGTVADSIFQQDRFKVTLDNGLYFYLSGAPRVGERVEVRVKVECLA